MTAHLRRRAAARAKQRNFLGQSQAFGSRSRRLRIESLEHRRVFALTVTTAELFTVLDAADGNADGILTVVGDLTIKDGGSINANDPNLPTNADASPPIVIVVSGKVIIESDTAGALDTGIFAENRIAGGDGGNISITAADDFIMQSRTVVSSSKLSGAGDTGIAGNITIDVGGSVELNEGAVVKADGPGPAGDITFIVDENFTMFATAGPLAGALISSNGGSGNGGDITVTVNGDVFTDTGSEILSEGQSGGAIEITGQNIDIDGTVSSHGTITGVGPNQPPGGGTITIVAQNTLTVSDTGVVSSSGRDPGADLVHLEACKIYIYGLVESTGAGHSVPNDPPNHLNGANRPDKDPNSTAGVEIWAGQFLVIDAKDHNGQINADLTLGAIGRTWIDLFAVGDITIIGDTVGPFAVHATNGGNNPTGGAITVKSTTASITASGLAIDASAAGSGFPDGGTIIVEAKQNVTLDTATLLARGDFNGSGGYGNGGHIFVRAYNGSLSWENGLGDVRPTGIDPPPPPTLVNSGTILLTYSTSISVAGSSFPTGGATPDSLPPADPPFPDIAQATGGAPTVPDYVIFTICIADPMDFGDAPENPIVPGDYPTLLANDGARHEIINGFHLGAIIDAELDGQPNGTATGDDDNPLGDPDDEDGVIFNGPFVPGLSTSITVTLTGVTGLLDAWFDWNGDGFWTAGEQVFTNQILVSGANPLLVNVPLNAIVDVNGAPTFSRFRLSSDGNLLPTGLALDGEVEDYKLHIFPYWTSKCAVITQIGETFAIPDVLVDVDNGPLVLDASKVGTLAPATRSIQAAVNYVSALGVSPISGIAGDVNGDGILLVAVTAKDTLVQSAAAGGIPFVGRDLGGDGTENFVITNTKSGHLKVFGNSVTMHAADKTKPVATIKSSVGKVSYMDVHGADSNVAGILVGGATAGEKNAESVLVKNTSATNNTGGIGIWVRDDKVEVSGSQHLFGNKIGIQIDGDKNVLRTNNEIMKNSQLGIKVTGSYNEIKDQDVGKSGYANGTGGIEVTGNSNSIQDSIVAFNNGTGIKITGNSNVVKQNELLNNALDAIWIALGNSNQILENDIFSNGGDGVDVKGDSNVIQKNSIGEKNMGNGGDGIRVAGKTNQIIENLIFGSLGDGIEIVGDSNTISKNKVGDKSKGGNGLGNVAGNRDGIRVTGKTNLLDDNTVSANKGFGIYIAGSASTGNKLKNNKGNAESSGSASENGLAEYKFEAAIVNQGGNKKDNANFTLTAIGTYE